MKIAYITQSYPPMISGAAVVVKRLAHGMVARGHDVLVIAASDKGNAYTTKEDSLKVLRLASLPNPRRANQSFVLWSRKNITEEIKRYCPDILHIHDIFSLGIFGLKTAQSLNIPTVSTVHQLPWFITAYLPELPGLHKTVEYSLWKYSLWLNKQCHTMVVPTQTIAETVEEKVGIRPKSITNGVELQRFTTREIPSSRLKRLFEKYKLDPNLPIILHVGRLDTDKNVETVIRAAAVVIQKNNIQLLVIGDGEHRHMLIELADELGISDRSHFPGFVSPSEDLPELYRLSAVFTTASEIETQGLVLLEALASGLPVVAVNATCIPELVINGRNGYLVSPGDINGMAKALTDIISNPILAKRMGIAGRSIVQQHSITSSFDQHEAMYRELIEMGQGLSDDNDSPISIAHKGKIQNILQQPVRDKTTEGKAD